MFYFASLSRSVLVIALTVFCGSVSGNEINKSVSDFTKIRMAVPGSIDLVPSDEHRVSIVVVNGRRDNLEIDVRRGKLELRQNCGKSISCISNSIGIEGTIYYRTLDALAIDGAGQMTAKDLTSTELKLDIRGVGEAEFGTVSAESLTMTSSGAGDFSIEKAEFNDLSAKVQGVGYVEFGELKSESADITISGAGEFLIENAEFRDLSVKVRGVGSIEIEDGTSKSCEVDVAGAGSFEGLGLESEVADVTIAGAADVSVHASDSLNAALYGAGSVTYAGDPEVSSEIYGAGEISRR